MSIELSETHEIPIRNQSTTVQVTIELVSNFRAHSKLLNYSIKLVHYGLIRFVGQTGEAMNEKKRKIIISNLMTSFSNAFSCLLSTLFSSCWYFLSFFLVLSWIFFRPLKSEKRDSSKERVEETRSRLSDFDTILSHSKISRFHWTSPCSVH